MNTTKELIQSASLFACLLLVSITLIPDTANAAGKKRGKPMTDTRFDYCQSKQKQCLADVEKDCNAQHDDANSRQICIDGGASACARSWGVSNGCWTREKVQPPGGRFIFPKAVKAQKIKPSNTSKPLSKSKLVTPNIHRH